MAHDVFVSYSQKDKPVADAVAARLEQEGVRCWMAPRDILPGTSWGESIVAAIGTARVMVLVLSGSSNRSRQVVREVERAVAEGLVIIPFRIEEIDPSGAMAYFLATEHWLDALTPPLERHVDRLTETVKMLLSGHTVPAHTAAPSPGRAASKPRRSWVPVALGAVVAVAAAAIVGVVLASGRGSSTTGAPAATTAPTTAATAVPPAETTTTLPTAGLAEVGRYQPIDLDPTDLQPAGLSYGLDADGAVLALANGTDGVTRLSIGNPARPLPMETFGVYDAREVVLLGDHICALSGDPGSAQLHVFPTDGSGGTTLAPRTGTAGSLYNLAAADGYLYLAGHDYVGIIDARDPASPAVVFEWEPPGRTGNPANVFVGGGVGYFSAGWDGLYIFDLADPAAPALLGRWPSPGWVISVVAADGIAYATLGEAGLATVDVSDPRHPVLLGVVELPGFASPLDVAYGHAFVGLYRGGSLGGIAVVDVREPTDPVLVDTFGRLQEINGLQVAGRHLFVTEVSQGLIVYEITGIG